MTTLLNHTTRHGSKGASYLYACKFSNGAIKVGRSSDPSGKIARSGREAARFGLRMLDSRAVTCTGDAQKAERWLIERCKTGATGTTQDGLFLGLNLKNVSKWMTEAIAIHWFRSEIGKGSALEVMKMGGHETTIGLKGRIAVLLQQRADDPESAGGMTLSDIGRALNLPKTAHPELSAALTKLRDEGGIRRVKGPATSTKGPRFVNFYSWINRAAKERQSTPMAAIDDRRYLSMKP